MSSDPAIRLRGLGKTFPIYRKPHHRLAQMLSRDKARWYREFPALRDVSLTIGRGETVGIVGRNGSGKSTLLQMICGTLTPSAGELEVNGRIAALLELGAGFNPEFTGRENVFLNGSILGVGREEMAAKFETIAAFADIGQFIEQPVKTYSSGMFVRLAFAVAIHVDPEILVIDEALSVGDEGFQRKCFARIDAIREAGATVLFVSHSAGTVVDLCDRAVLLDRGELLAEGTPRHVVSRYHKLLNTPEDKVEAVRSEIRGGWGDDEADPAPAKLASGSGTSPASVVDEAYWERGLVPSSTVEYECRGASIEDPHLHTLDGRRVNVLAPGGEYVYSYSVRLAQSFVGLRCGMLIRTVTGVDLAGAVTRPGDQDGTIYQAGAVLRVRFRFRCLLGPGTYFLNAGVRAVLGGSEEFVARYIDVAMFRVMPREGRTATGLVDLDFVPQILHEGSA